MEEKKLLIKGSYIEENNGLYRMTTPIIENGKEYTVYIEVEKEYAQYLTPERADAQVFLALPVAVREGYDIYCETPVTEMFLHNLNEILIPHLALGDSRIHKIQIHARTDDTPIGGKAVGTGISCGVDSLFTVKEYTDKKYPGMDLTHLFIASLNMELIDTRNADLNEWVKQHKEEFDRYEIVSKETNLPLVKMYTNYFFYICGSDFGRDWKWYHHLYTHTYITMAAVLSLKKLWRIYYFASSYDFTSFTLKNNFTNDPAHYEVLCMHTLSVPDFICYSGGACYNRFEKTKALIDYPVAQKTLHPCHSKGEKNCSKPDCDKCLRALLVFDYYDKLDNFQNVFDIAAYRRNHNKYLYNLVKLYHNSFSRAFYEQIYDLIKEKYPHEMAQAEALYEWDASPTVQKWEYNIINRSYETALAMLKLDNPSSVLKNYFTSVGIKKLYISGAPRLGEVIKTLLSNFPDEIQVFDYHNGKAQNCDAVLILDAANSVIERKSKVFEGAGIQKKNIYSFFDLKNILEGKRDS